MASKGDADDEAAVGVFCCGAEPPARRLLVVLRAMRDYPAVTSIARLRRYVGQGTGTVSDAVARILRAGLALEGKRSHPYILTDAGLAQIKGMTTLTRLHLEQTKVTDKGLANLKGLVNLEYLNLYGTEITDRGLEELAGLSKLKSLYLWQTKATEGGVGKLKKALPNLEIVSRWEEKEEPKEKK